MFVFFANPLRAFAAAIDLPDNFSTSINLSVATPAGPVITGFNPTAGAPGTVVTVTGLRFSAATGAAFGRVSASFSILSDTMLTATVPPTALSGPVSVSDSFGNVTSSAGTFTVSPRISSVAPGGGAPGASINIIGVNFNGTDTVLFGTTPAAFTVSSALLVQATVPAGATTGLITVINPGGPGTSARIFFVAPAIASFSPAADTVGKPVRITGTNFQGSSAVMLNGTSASFVVDSPTQITARVPRGAQSGPISVTNPGGTVTSADSFIVFRGGSIGGIVWNDLDSNAVKDSGEPGLAGVVVDLREAGADSLFNDSDDVVSPPETTAVDGSFDFTDLPGGNYRLVVDERTLPGSFIATAGNDSISIMLSTGQVAIPDSFGFHQTPTLVCVRAYFDANHNGTLDSGESPMGGISFHLTGSAGTYSGTTDSTGSVCFTNVKVDNYVLTESVPPGYSASNPASGMLAFSVRAGEDSTFLWLNGAARDTVLYRTASMLDWATAADQKGKHKAVKCKPDKVDFELYLRAPKRATSVTVKFPMFTKGRLFADSAGADSLLSWDSVKQVAYAPAAPIDSNALLHIIGRGFKGKAITAAAEWATVPRPTKSKYVATDFLLNILRLPMPDLENIGSQLETMGRFPFTIGNTSGAHSVIFMKYADVLKSLNQRETFHTGAPRCLDLVSGRPFLKQQKGLPPSKEDNSLFAEALALKLNILSFPALGQLIYDDHDSAPTPLDSLTIDSIATVTDEVLSCANAVVPAATPQQCADVLHKINGAFSGPVDTLSWSCGTIVLKGVKALADVPFLRAIPGSQPAPRIPIWAGIRTAEPVGFQLSQNYPNPFNPTTTIEFNLAVPSLVTISVYNVLGQEVVRIFDKAAMDEGSQTVEFDARNLASGVYFCRLVAVPIPDGDATNSRSDFISVKKMMLLR